MEPTDPLLQRGDEREVACPGPNYPELEPLEILFFIIIIISTRKEKRRNKNELAKLFNVQFLRRKHEKTRRQARTTRGAPPPPRRKQVRKHDKEVYPRKRGGKLPSRGRGRFVTAIFLPVRPPFLPFSLWQGAGACSIAIRFRGRPFDRVRL